MRPVFVGTLTIAVACLAPALAQAQTELLKNAIGMEFAKIAAGEFTAGLTRNTLCACQKPLFCGRGIRRPNKQEPHGSANPFIT